MTTNLEVFMQWNTETQAEFDAWNEKQPENRKIRNRLPWSVNFPKIKFLALDKKQYTDEKGNQGMNFFKRMRYDNSQGMEVAYKVQSPSVIAPRGFCIMKTTKGDFKTILVVYDRENPDHRRYTDNIENDITTPAVHEILKSPTDFGVQSKSFPEITDAIKATKEYEMVVYSIKEKLAKILNLQKKSGGFDFDSPLRTVFLTPLFYQDKDKPNDPPSVMAVYIKTNPDSPAVAITPDELYEICDGFEGIKDGKKVRGEKKGFECSPETNFGKLNAGSKPSTTAKCSAITITRFQAAPKSNSQEEKLKYLDSHSISDEYSLQMKMDDLLTGLRNACAGGPPGATGNYNPMDTPNSGPPPTPSPENGGDKSFLGSMDTKPSAAEPQQPAIQQPAAQTIPVSSIPGLGLPQIQMQPSQFGVPIIGQQQFSLGVPPMTQQQNPSSFSDRIQSFGLGQLNATGSI